MSETPERRNAVTDEDLLRDAIPIDPSELQDGSDESQSLAESNGPPEENPLAPPKIRHTDAMDQRKHEDAWNRTPNTTGHGAIHVKTFYCRLRPEAIENMDAQINQWLDAHPQYEVKYVTSAVGQLKGKSEEDALFVTVWV